MATIRLYSKDKEMHDAGYIRVDKNIHNSIYFDNQASTLYGKTHFYVAKYEMKDVGGVATSQADLTPWVNITQTNAIAECEALGDGYHLITNDEWMAIARDVEAQAVNWTGGAVGSGVLKSGNTGSLTDGSYNGSDPESGINRNTKAELTLSNGETIWDLSGNVWEWTNNTISCASSTCTVDEMPYDSTPGSEYVEFTNLSTYGELSYDDIRPANSSYNSSQGVGKIYTDVNTASDGGNVHAFLRGGSWSVGANAGAFALALDASPSISSTYIGFRCAR